MFVNEEVDCIIHMLCRLKCLYFSRFILNVPDEYKRDPIRTFFHIELAHWFYIDFFVPEQLELKSVGIKEFAVQDILLSYT